MTVRTAVIPAAGLGTRFLPATRVVPKAMLPVVDKPAIQYVVEEAAAAGIRDILVIVGPGSDLIRDHFAAVPQLEAYLDDRGKHDELEMVRAISGLADVHLVHQRDPRGLGHAVGLARDHVGDEPFAVLLGDDLMHANSTLLRDMLATHEREQASVLALMRCAPEQISSYGAATVEPVAGRTDVVRVRGVVEKPAPGEAPSDLAVIGRYVLTPEIFDAVDGIEPGKGGELQLTDAIDAMLPHRPVFGQVFETGRFDAGNPLDFLKATVELALERDDIGPPFRRWLEGRRP